MFRKLIEQQIEIENIPFFKQMFQTDIIVFLQQGALRRDLSRWFSAKEYQKSNGAATRHLYGSPSTI